MYHHWFYWSEVIGKTDSYRPRPAARYLPDSVVQALRLKKAFGWGAGVCEQNMLPLFYAIATSKCQVGHVPGPDLFMANRYRYAPQCTPPPFVHCYGSNKSIMHQWLKRASDEPPQPASVDSPVVVEASHKHGFNGDRTLCLLT